MAATEASKLKHFNANLFHQKGEEVKDWVWKIWSNPKVNFEDFHSSIVNLACAKWVTWMGKGRPSFDCYLKGFIKNTMEKYASIEDHEHLKVYIKKIKEVYSI